MASYVLAENGYKPKIVFVKGKGMFACGATEKEASTAGTVMYDAVKVVCYAESFGGALYHYQDYRGRKIDAVIELPDGQWCAFEIKLGANQIDAAAQSLLNIQKEFADDPKGKPPAALCVLCGMANAAYRRPDGVFVVPITALKP